jgi:hypothetical protein
MRGYNKRTDFRKPVTVERNMPRPLRTLCLAASLLSLTALAGDKPAVPARTTLTAFHSEKELEQWFEHQQQLFKKKNQRQRSRGMKKLSEAPLQEAKSAAPAAAEASITNVQTAGVDEGGIVKQHGDYLIILRRGRLFTIRIGDGQLTPASYAPAYAPDSQPYEAWYDEILVSGSTIAVIGYSYRKGGTEIVLFTLGEQGELQYRATHILRSNDYYSSRNYASRLIGNKLIFYTPLFLNFWRELPDNLPAVRHWQAKEPGSFQRIAPATQIYRTTDDLDPAGGIALHTVQICDIADAGLTCTAKGILAQSGREFYVSKDAVYIWTAPWAWQKHTEDTHPVNASLFRLPLNATEAPTAIKAWGSPIDQFSFKESEDGHLYVLLRAEAPVRSMWASEVGSGDLALLRLPIRDPRFGEGSQSTPVDYYHPLPAPQGNPRSIQNRYVGNYLVYGAGRGPRWSKTIPHTAYFVDWAKTRLAGELSLEHPVERIEALGNAPLLVGAQQNDLYFSSIAADKREETAPFRVASQFVLSAAAQGETRSHGFFYKPTGPERGILGLPFRGQGWQRLANPSGSGIIYLGNDNLNLRKIGTLTAETPTQKDNCITSCVDWYGNARPLFIWDRLFALMGYEIVEGRIVDGKLTEIRRIDYGAAKRGGVVR